MKKKKILNIYVTPASQGKCRSCKKENDLRFGVCFSCATKAGKKSKRK